MNPGDAPRRGLVWVLAAAVVATVVSVPILLDTDEAAADELEPFASCEELAAWTPAEVFAREAEQDGDAGGIGGAEEPMAATDESASADSGADRSTGETNVAVEGVDELDVIDRIDERRVLVAANGTLALVDVVDGITLATVPALFDARITYDPDAAVVWLAGTNDRGETQVSRATVSADSLSVDGTWSAAGYLVDARRTGDRFHVVAVAGFSGIEGDAIPFEDGPVPCDDVLHPVAPSGPEATLVVTLPATGDVAPVSAAEVVGSGQLLHVTNDAVFLATPIWEGDEPETSIHRFDLATLTHTGSGRVGGSLLNQFSMSEHGGFLRVGVTHQGARVFIDDVVFDEPATDPIPIEPGSGGSEEPVTPPEPEVRPEPEVEENLNEIVVLDTEGDLDIVGRTERFGHPGETLHGIRFDGEIAYAVTFLQTDPFYVIDVADPAAPRVVGEVELPGFSAYLHPIGDGLVAGFGPGEDGRAAVKLFDVSDPTQPAVVDDETLGADTPVTWDHHAFLGLGDGRFAVPATSWRLVDPPNCSEAVRLQLTSEATTIEAELYGTPAPTPERAQILNGQLEAIWSNPCLNPPYVVDTTVVVAGTAGGTIDVEERLTVTSDQEGTRILGRDEGWLVLAGAHLIAVDSSGDVTYDLRVVTGRVVPTKEARAERN